jgi:hypothetical protein
MLAQVLAGVPLLLSSAKSKRIPWLNPYTPIFDELVPCG